MAPKKRTLAENRGLPPRWEWHRGKLHYQIPPALAGHPAFGGRRRRILLGGTLTEAHRRWSEIQSHFDNPVLARALPDVIQAYQTEELPTLAPKTQRDYRSSLARLSLTFQTFTLEQVEPHHCYAYVDQNLGRVRQARYDIRVLSSVLSWCVSKGLLKSNPLIGQLRFKNKRHSPAVRKHYIPDEDLTIFLKTLPWKWQLYVMLKLKTGQSQQTLLTTMRPHLSDAGIDFSRSKTGVSIPMEWDDALRAIVNDILRLPRPVGSLYLFANRWGGCYYDMSKGTASGFQSMWQRHQKAALEAGMSATFTEHQLRHKAASDNPLAAASAALGHSDERITRDVYQVLKPRVKPLGISPGLKWEKQ